MGSSHTKNVILEKAGRFARKRHLKDAKRYLRRRAQVREFLLAEFDKAGSSDMIVIAHKSRIGRDGGHSPFLGSGTAHPLSDHCRITNGGDRMLEEDRKPLNRDFPYGSVSAWINIWCEQ